MIFMVLTSRLWVGLKFQERSSYIYYRHHRGAVGLTWSRIKSPNEGERTFVGETLAYVLPKIAKHEYILVACTEWVGVVLLSLPLGQCVPCKSFDGGLEISWGLCDRNCQDAIELKLVDVFANTAHIMGSFGWQRGLRRVSGQICGVDWSLFVLIGQLSRGINLPDCQRM